MPATESVSDVKATPILSRGPWAQLIAIKDCLCPDGVRRLVRVGIPDSMSSAPGRVQAQGKTVSGFVTTFDRSDDYEFIATGKNASVFAGWSSGHPIPEGAPEGRWTWSRMHGCFVSLDSGDYRAMDETGTVYQGVSTLARAQGR